MKNTTHTARTTNAALKNSTPATAANNSKTADEIFFAEETIIANEARSQAIEVITRFLLWIAEGTNAQSRGTRATLALYCVRPDLVGCVTLEQIGEMTGISRQGAYKLAHDFRVSMGL